ncbi:MAG: 2-isopropylmalate synthase, partial [Nitrospinota bacterium]|nr:2-isopropylmalate synthase [Nitrospinota bacterium]
RDHKLLKSKDEVIRMAVDAVKFGRKFCDDIEFSPEDASRTEPDFLAEVVEAVIGAGAGTVNIPDTVGYSVPSQFGQIIRSLKQNVPNIEQAVISVHCHNDLGMAVANSLEAIREGARQVECTINGIGERAGNAAMEEIVMALKTRKDFFNIDTRLDTKHIMACSRLVSSLTGFFVQRNKAIVGKNAFAHESGVHQDGYLKKKDTYEIMNPQDIGLDNAELVLGKHSGRNALSKKIEAMGFQVTQEDLDRVFAGFKSLADQKKEVFDEDIVALIQKRKFTDEELNTYTLEKIQGTFESGTTPDATVTLKSRDGKVHTETSQGDGPIDAIYNAIDHITGMTCKLIDYQVMAKTRGKDAQGEVTVRVSHENREVLGKGTGVNTVEASAEAYVNAINKLLVKTKSGPVGGGEIQGP